MYHTRIRSRHSTHSDLRFHKELQFPIRSVFRLGSSSLNKDIFKDVPEVLEDNNFIEVNTRQSIRNSSSKIKMKMCFDKTDIPHAEWYLLNANGDFCQYEKVVEPRFPILAKRIYGSRGRGMYKLNNIDEFVAWKKEIKDEIKNYMFERFHNYGREYRLHVSEFGCFYTNRKVRKKDTPKDQMWYFNNSNCSWLLEQNANFDKPVNWDKIEKACIEALKSVGADILAFDVRVQNTYNRDGEERPNPLFKIIECNSAPSFGDITRIKYIVELNKIIKKKCVELQDTLVNKETLIV